MGCGACISGPKGPTLSEQLQASRSERDECQTRLEEKEEQLRKVQEAQRDLDARLQHEEAQVQHEGEEEVLVAELRSKLEERQVEHVQALDRERQELQAEHRQKLQQLQEEHDENLQLSLQGGREAHSQVLSQLQSAQDCYEELVKFEEAAEMKAKSHQQEAEIAERELSRLQLHLVPLRQEKDEAIAALQEARYQLRNERDDRASSSKMSSALELRLAEANEERSRSEQRFSDLEGHLQAQTRDLRIELSSRTDELRQREEVLQERDVELGEVNSQLSDMQSLFDDVSQQLQAECGRISRLQDTVSHCASQGRELEALQGMLEESHKMLAQVRDALDQERTERIKTAGLLEHEQQRTQLLLDVLKHFKQKLQGLTPQALLSRLGVADAKTLLASTGASGVGLASPSQTVPLLSSASPLLTLPPGKIPGNGVVSVPSAQSPASLNGAKGAAALGNFGSPRFEASDGMASTIAPDLSSLAAWADGTGSSVGAPGIVRTPSPAAPSLP